MPRAFAIAMAILVVAYALLRVGDKAIETGHKAIALLRDLRKYRRGR